MYWFWKDEGRNDQLGCELLCMLFVHSWTGRVWKQLLGRWGVGGYDRGGGIRMRWGVAVKVRYLSSMDMK